VFGNRAVQQGALGVAGVIGFGGETENSDTFNLCELLVYHDLLCY